MRFLKETSKTNQGEKARIIGDFGDNENLDTMWYISHAQTPYDSIMGARYHESSEFKRFWASKISSFGELFNIRSVLNKPDADVAVLFCNELRNIIAKGSYFSFPVPHTYGELEAMRGADGYAARFPQPMRTYITRCMNTLLDAGWCLLLDESCDIVKKMLIAIKMEKLDEFLRIILSPEALKALKALD